MNPSIYAHYRIEDLLSDDFFVQWVIRPDEKSDLFWNAVMREYPERQSAIDEAAAVIRMYRMQDFAGGEVSRNLVWERVSSSINRQKRIIGLFRSPAMRAAAAVLVIATLTVFFLMTKYAGSEFTVSTLYGEIKTVTLPDHSTVSLNGNSTLFYKRSWNEQTAREVWVEGEAYFKVVHINKDTLHISPSERFIVHCGSLNIEVLGTTFNVKARRGITDIALVTGKIRVNYAQQDVAGKSVVMAPGDYIQYTAKRVMTARKIARPARIAVWKNDEISFTDASLKEIVETLEDNFGYAVSMKDSSLLALKIEGDISVGNVADLLDVVRTTLGVRIIQSSGKRINIDRK